MKLAIKRRWLKALRSGRYKKGVEALKDIDSNTFCCLGVLTDIMRIEHKAEWSSECTYGDIRFNSNEGLLNKGVMRWAGLKNSSPQIPAKIVKKVYGKVHEDDGNSVGLVSLNDSPFYSGRAKGFSKIAKCIQLGL